MFSKGLKVLAIDLICYDVPKVQAMIEVSIAYLGFVCQILNTGGDRIVYMYISFSRFHCWLSDWGVCDLEAARHMHMSCNKQQFHVFHCFLFPEFRICWL